ncbi:MAG: UbiA family prenyltransferase [Pseudomonadota bacterium]
MTVAEKLWTYQSERFPLIKTIPLLAVLAIASIHVSAALAGRDAPALSAYAAAAVLALIVFFQMRVADEHKDYADDCRYRPERAVPRGLVTLAFLARLAGLTALIAAGLALTQPPPVAVCLLLVWAWLYLMTREFFAVDWLKAHPILYLISHMAILPLIVLLLTSFEWARVATPPPGLMPFLGLAFLNGCVLEIGRKVWAPEHERDGVETYSGLWGPGRAIWIWAALTAISAVLLVWTGWQFAHGRLPWIAALVGAAGAIYVATLFASRQDAAAERLVDRASGLWVLISYGALAARLPSGVAT